MKSKSLFILFLTLAFLFNTPLQTAPLSAATHHELITSNIDRLSLIQNQIFTLAQKILFSATEADSSIQNDLSLINHSIDDVNKALYIYSNKLTDDAPEKRDAFLLINAANYIKSSVYELKALSKQASPPEKMMILERYFNYRVYASNTIRLVANLLSRKY